MRCLKCGSKMFMERIFAPQGWYWSWHCIFCGSYYDPLSLANSNESLERIGRIRRVKLRAPCWGVS